MIREQDPLKQGLKPALKLLQAIPMCIREQDPLKQGLKRVRKSLQLLRETYSRARSTKTRIETNSKSKRVRQ